MDLVSHELTAENTVAQDRSGESTHAAPLPPPFGELTSVTTIHDADAARPRTSRVNRSKPAPRGKPRRRLRPMPPATSSSARWRVSTTTASPWCGTLSILRPHHPAERPFRLPRSRSAGRLFSRSSREISIGQSCSACFCPPTAWIRPSKTSRRQRSCRPRLMVSNWS